MELSQIYLRGHLLVQTTLPSCSCLLPPISAGRRFHGNPRSHQLSPLLLCWGAASPTWGFMGQCHLTELLRGATHCSRFGWLAVDGHLTPQLSSGAVSVARLCCWCLLCSKAGCSFSSASPQQEQASSVLPQLGEKKGAQIWGERGVLFNMQSRIEVHLPCG